MNKKITVRSEVKGICYCILSGERDLEEQFNVLLFGSAQGGGGVCARFDGKTLRVVDYFHDDTMARFDVIDIEDTDSEPILKWVESK